MSGSSSLAKEDQVSVQKIKETAASVPPPSGKLLQFGHLALKTKVEEFLQLLYALNVEPLEMEQIESVEKSIRLVIHAMNWIIQAEEWKGHFNYYNQKLSELRESADLLSAGYSPDPSKKPSEKDIQDIVNDRAEATWSELRSQG